MALSSHAQRGFTQKQHIELESETADTICLSLTRSGRVVCFAKGGGSGGGFTCVEEVQNITITRQNADSLIGNNAYVSVIHQQGAIDYFYSTDSIDFYYSNSANILRVNDTLDIIRQTMPTDTTAKRYFKVITTICSDSIIVFENTDNQQLTQSNDTIYLENGGFVVVTGGSGSTYFEENGNPDSIITVSGVNSVTVNCFKSNCFGSFFDGRIEVAPAFYLNAIGMIKYAYGGSMGATILDLSPLTLDSAQFNIGFTSSTNMFTGMQVLPSSREAAMKADSVISFETQQVIFNNNTSINTILNFQNAGTYPNTGGVNNGDTLRTNQHYVNVLVSDTFKIYLPPLSGDGVGNEYIIYHEPYSSGMTIIYPNDTTSEAIEHDNTVTDSIIINNPGESITIIPDIGGNNWGVVSHTGRKGANGIVINYTPTDSTDTNYSAGQITYDLDYLYIKTQDLINGGAHIWRRISLSW